MPSDDTGHHLISSLVSPLDEVTPPRLEGTKRGRSDEARLIDAPSAESRDGSDGPPPRKKTLAEWKRGRRHVPSDPEARSRPVETRRERHEVGPSSDSSLSSHNTPALVSPVPTIVTPRTINSASVTINRVDPPPRNFVELPDWGRPIWLDQVQALSDFEDHGLPPHARVRVGARRAWSTNDILWTVSPNMDWICNVPHPKAAPELQCDGLLGLYEWTHVPRDFLAHRPHEALIRLPTGLEPLTHLLMRPLSRSDIVWDALRPVGLLHERLRIQIRREHDRVWEMIKTRWPRALTSRTLPHDSRRHGMMTLAHLANGKSLWGHQVLFWRQWQRCMRDLLAWCDWFDLLERNSRSCSPAMDVDTTRRGVITGDIDVVKMYAVLGVPVWFVRTFDYFLPSQRVVPIRSPFADGYLASDPAPPDWEVPDIFRNVYDAYAPFRLPNSGVNSIPDAPPVRRQLVYGSEVDRMVSSQVAAEDRDMKWVVRSIPPSSSRSPTGSGSAQSRSRNQQLTRPPTSASRSRNAIKISGVDDRAFQRDKTRDVQPAWAPTPISIWVAAAERVEISRDRAEHLAGLPCPVVVETGFRHVVPPLTLFYKSIHKDRYMYNWILASELWIPLLETDPALQTFHQDSQAWRNTLSGRFDSSKARRPYDFAAMDLPIVVETFPSSPWKLTWRGVLVDSSDTLMDPTLLQAVLWELSEIAFLYSFLVLDRRVLHHAVDSEPYDLSRRHIFLEAWHSQLMVNPSFDNLRHVEASSTDWATRRPFIEVFSNLLSDWPIFPDGLKSADGSDEQSFCAYERRLITFFCQVFVDHFARLPPLPHIRPNLPIAS